MNPLFQVHHWVEGLFTGVVAVSVFSFALYLTLKRSDAPGLLFFKWIITVLVVSWLVWFTDALTNKTAMDFTHVAATLFGGLILAAVWRHNITGMLSRPFTALYDGGDDEVDPQPFYSIAESKRKQGKYLESIAEIRKQLKRFPTDYTGQLMLAEIQAENMNDLPGAELTIQRMIEQPKHAPRNITHALNTLADWQLKYALDRDAARAHLEKIIELFPKTELALAAEQRISHLATAAKMVEPHDRQKYVVKEGIQNLGLVIDRTRPSSSDATPGDADAKATEYTKHLTNFPMDFEVREKLANLYADHYRRLDLATDQLEQMIGAVGQPAKKVAHWLNLLADLQIRQGADFETVRTTLQRIVDRYPDMPMAETARTRLGRLKLEMKGQDKTAGVKMGTYEQNIGLKQSLNRKY